MHGKSKVFSTLDANSLYLQVEMEYKNREKFALTPHHDLYRFVHMPFGLNAHQKRFK